MVVPPLPFNLFKETKIMKYPFRLLCACMVLSITGCSASQNNNVNSLLWMQSSAEYRSVSIQVYSSALKQVDEALRDNTWTAAKEQAGNCSSLPPAVVMDIDETVLDNSRYMGRSVLEGNDWDPITWDAWVARCEAEAIAGSVEFVGEMQRRNVQVIFITNRACMKRQGSTDPCPQETDTAENLAKTGITGVSPENLLLAGEKQGWGSEKKSRREEVAKKYRIIMLFGDDLGDFLPGVKAGITPEERKVLVEGNRENWGRRWFMLPNPTYGSWLNILHEPKTQYIKNY